MSLIELGQQLLDAAQKGETDHIKLLMCNGAPFTTDWFGTTPLHLAAQNGHVSTAEVLIHAGITIDTKSKLSRTPLHMAAQSGHLGMVQLLIRNGSNVNIRDMLNMTPLHWAVESGKIEIVELLLKHGAWPSVKSKFDKSPLDIAVINFRADMVNVLKSAEQLQQLHEEELIIDDTHTLNTTTSLNLPHIIGNYSHQNSTLYSQNKLGIPLLNNQLSGARFLGLNSAGGSYNSPFANSTLGTRRFAYNMKYHISPYVKSYTNFNNNNNKFVVTNSANLCGTSNYLVALNNKYRLQQLSHNHRPIPPITTKLLESSKNAFFNNLDVNYETKPKHFKLIDIKPEGVSDFVNPTALSLPQPSHLMDTDANSDLSIVKKEFISPDDIKVLDSQAVSNNDALNDTFLMGRNRETQKIRINNSIFDDNVIQIKKGFVPKIASTLSSNGTTSLNNSGILVLPSNNIINNSNIVSLEQTLNVNNINEGIKKIKRCKTSNLKCDNYNINTSVTKSQNPSSPIVTSAIRKQIFLVVNNSINSNVDNNTVNTISSPANNNDHIISCQKQIFNINKINSILVKQPYLKTNLSNNINWADNTSLNLGDKYHNLSQFLNNLTSSPNDVAYSYNNMNNNNEYNNKNDDYYNNNNVQNNDKLKKPPKNMCPTNSLPCFVLTTSGKVLSDKEWNMEKTSISPINIQFPCPKESDSHNMTLHSGQRDNPKPLQYSSLTDEAICAETKDALSFLHTLSDDTVQNIT